METIIQHYDKEYYREHYAAFLDDEKYIQGISSFYLHAIFTELGLDATCRILDFGSGPGQLTGGVKADCYDPSAFIQGYLREIKRTTFAERSEIPQGAYRAVFSSHSLEHCLNPADELKAIHGFLEEKGLLILVLPKEQVPGIPTSSVDNNRHLFGWNFQLITNLLSATGYRVLRQRVFTAPYGLRTLTGRFSTDAAVKWSHRLGQWFNHYPALLTIAEKAEAK